MNRLECLDGLRGLAALWVLVGHAMILTGFVQPIIGQPELGVDLFIMLSGFLMVFQYQLRREQEDWDRPATWAAFWLRRFFRIAPLYYLLLLIALLAGPAIYGDRMVIDAALDRVPQVAERYTDQSAANILMHLSFLFGLHPDYAFRTPLPDWSLGLEMQFYAVFPLLILLARRFGWLAGAVLIAVVGLVVALGVQRMGVDFPMPSFLPLKLHMFLCGMLIAVDAASGSAKRGPFLLLILALAALPIGGDGDLVHLLVRVGLAATFFALIHCRGLGAIDWLARALGTRLFHWLGELSYGAYLFHLLIMHAVAAWAFGRFGPQFPASLRFALVVTIVAAATYSAALVTYLAVERPGQALGRRILRRWQQPRS